MLLPLRLLHPKSYLGTGAPLAPVPFSLFHDDFAKTPASFVLLDEMASLPRLNLSKMKKGSSMKSCPFLRPVEERVQRGARFYGM